MRIDKALAAFACAGILWSCSSTAIPIPTAKNLEYANQNGRTATLSSLNLGRTLYIKRCSACHSLRMPASLSPEAWPKMVDSMAVDAKINEEQKFLITQYLISIAASSAAKAAESSIPAPKESILPNSK